jgi:hypothetical protein
MDGELRIFRAAGDDEVAEQTVIVEAMESETRSIFQEARDSGLPFATWEMKSPLAGPHEVMLAVPNLGNFSWTSCTHPNCTIDQKRINEFRKIKDIKVGEDALAPPWKLKASLFPTKRCLLQLHYRRLFQTLSLSHCLHLLAGDLPDRRGNRPNSASLNQLQRQPPLFQWCHHHN